MPPHFEPISFLEGVGCGFMCALVMIYVIFRNPRR